MTEPAAPPSPTGPLAGLRVLDLSRVLAGPWCTQVLGDLGAEVIKVEQPGQGDDTRRWGPPFLDDGSRDSAYYLCANRNKRSVAINISAPEGAALIRRMVLNADVVVENFRVGGLARYGLDYPSLRALKPDLVYCSITGFGQDGPYKDVGGYDFLIQGLSGLMSVTGLPDGVPGGGPMKVGLPVSDLFTGLYATISILAALRHRDQTGEGQHIDLALLDTQVSLLTNQASNWLNGDMAPRRLGNAHPNTVPYQDFHCADGEVLVALGNDRQFRTFTRLIDRPELADDPRFATSADRSVNRAELIPEMSVAIARWKAADLIAAMEQAGLPGGKVNEIPEALEHPQIRARGLVQEIARRDGTPVKFLGFPARLSATPADYRHAPPRSGEDTAAVLEDELGLTKQEIDRLLAAGIIAETLS
ncbi:CaiB/BaiF CoA-transferase family protein [Novosphingobium sp.]|uniref:CaiB/BaiF CoA transferase family protein n=1 Tax=Novosphingobium sp. TaxID=1874826 RepID=UPI002612507B|nr:CaiB/BaiF CoA-transferase family protein [Novosphingobium sp.]